MEFKLDEIVNIFKLIGAVDAYSLPFWFSFAIPVFYIAFKKLGGKTDDIPKSWADRIAELTRLPKVEGRVLVLSLILFVIGIFSLKIGQARKEQIRKAGLAVKNYCLNKNLYSPPLFVVARDTRIDSCIITQLEDEYPSQFWIDRTFPANPTLVLTDSVAFLSIMSKSEKLLDTYLANDSISKGSAIPYGRLFDVNQYFTFRLIEQLITNNPIKYTWDTVPLNNRRTQFDKYRIIKR